MTLDLVCFGNPTMDSLKTDDGKTLRLPGGSALNTGVIFSQLGGKPGIIGRIGKDADGEVMLEIMKKYCVDHKRLRIDDAPTNANDIHTTAQDRKVIVNPKYAIMDHLDAKDRAYVGNARAVLAGLRHNVFPELVEAAKEGGAEIYVSTQHLDLPKFKDKTFDIRHLGRITIIGNEPEMKALEGRVKFHPTAIRITTLGREGARYEIQGNEATVQQHGFTLTCVDPTGAGDAFAAGYIFGALNRMTPSESLMLGNACGAWTIKDYGAQQVLPRDPVRTVIDELFSLT